jgi:hypothetical protein
MHLTLSFCGEVYGQDIYIITPLIAKNKREETLLNSQSHWTTLMVPPNCVEM